jgi:hypothetical protein
MRLLIVALLAAFFASSARAEIAPMFYERMQKEAPEALAVDVVAVDQTEKKDNEGTVTSLVVQARVRQVERSASGVKPGDVVTIVYSVTEFVAPRPGMGSPPILKKGQSVMAYLKKEEKGERFELAAHGRSFAAPPMSTPPPPPR